MRYESPTLSSSCNAFPDVSPTSFGTFTLATVGDGFDGDGLGEDDVGDADDGVGGGAAGAVVAAGVIVPLSLERVISQPPKIRAATTIRASRPHRIGSHHRPRGSTGAGSAEAPQPPTVVASGGRGPRTCARPDHAASASIGEICRVWSAAGFGTI